MFLVQYILPMANYLESVLENVPGPYFVDEDCIACDTCHMEARKHFKLTNDSDHAYVFFQPTNSEERAVCDRALAACPVGAIGVREVS